MSEFVRVAFAAALLVGVGFADSAFAQAGPVRERPEDRVRRLERDLDLQRLQQGPGGGETQKLPVAAGGEGGDIRFQVKSISFSDSKILPQDKLAAIAAPFEGREVSLGDLNKLVAKISELYQAQGFPAGFAVVPPQTVENGVVQIILVEPTVDRIMVDGNAQTSTSWVTDRIPLRRGDLVDLLALEKAMLTVGRTSPTGLRLAAKLEPGDAFGTSRVRIVVIEPEPLIIRSITDNFGEEGTGRTRTQLVVTKSSMTGRDDPLTMVADRSKGSKGIFGIYDVPLNTASTRAEIKFSINDSAVIAGDFADLGVKSDGWFGAVTLKHPLLVDANWTVLAILEGSFSRSTTETGPLLVGTDIWRATTGLKATRFDETGFWNADVRAHAFRARSYDNIGSELDDTAKYTARIERVQSLWSLNAVAYLTAQATPDHLLASGEQFVIGGVGSIRAYELNQFSGDNGFEGGLEVRLPVAFVNDTLLKPFGGTMTVFAFAEGGGALPYRAGGDKVRREDFASDAGGGVELNLFGGRVGLRGQLAQPLDHIHRHVVEDEPKVLLDATVKLPF